MDLTVQHRVHIHITVWNVKVHATVADTFVMFPQDVQIFLQVNTISLSQRYDEEQLFI